MKKGNNNKSWNPPIALFYLFLFVLFGLYARYFYLATATVIDEDALDHSVLNVNGKARIKFIEDDEEEIITLVTTMDVDTDNMCISLESALGKALNGAHVGEIVDVEAPGDNYKVEVLEIL